ncbi:MAG: Uma2 family endonuclease [Oscillatoria sp. PMC 1051.18]|nr:Uma2 family endonuclease [Oscillatoria sp. PMC 1050.18]MEC5030836.1 Uma2 family endonuclease [Oscillatoria sp. PMC 1051.18]
MSLEIKDLEKIQSTFQQAHLDYQLELVDGKITIMGLSDYLSEEIIARLITFVNMWVLPRRMGRVTGSSAGFRLPDGNLRGPDISFVSASRLRRSPRSFAQIVPDLMVEVKSSTDRIKPIIEKIHRFLELGTTVAILIDPDRHTLTIYRATNSEAIELTDTDILTIPELFPGWELAISELWPPVFEDNQTE